MGARSRIMSTSLEVTLIILAGGASQRMQQDKAELQINDDTLLEWQINKFADTVADIYVSSSKLHHVNKAHIADLWTQKLGPVAAIVSSILYLQHTHLHKTIIFIPVDMPQISALEFQQLLQTNADGAFFATTPLPLMLRITTDLINYCQHVAALFDAGHNYSIKKFIAESGIIFQHCECQYPHKLININYPHEWEQFCHETSM